MDHLESCHNRLRSIFGNDIETVDVMRRAEEHRHHWRPLKARVILLAESHVYTMESELDHRVEFPDERLAGVPQGFVRLVYCLGYGENQILDRPLRNPKNCGTPQFWKIFYSCVNPVHGNSDFAPILKSGEINTAKRLENKIDLLNKLREKGVWLLDASLAALYAPHHPKPTIETIKMALHVTWDFYLRAVFQKAKPAQVVCVGRGVGKEMSSRIRESTGVAVEVLPQPNARISAAEHLAAFQTYYKICQNV